MRCTRWLSPRSRSGQRAKASGTSSSVSSCGPIICGPGETVSPHFLDQGELDSFLAMLRVPPPSADNDPETWFFRGVASRESRRLAYGRFAVPEGDRAQPFLQQVVLPARYGPGTAGPEGRGGLQSQEVVGNQRGTRSASRRFTHAFFDSFKAKEPDPAVAAAAAGHLAAICETLGWARPAQAWNREADGPG